MTGKELEFKNWITEKVKDKRAEMMIYACFSFEKSREGIRKLMLLCSKKYPNIDIPWGCYIVCGWADDLCKMLRICYPDFKEKFSKEITISKIEEITKDVLWGESKWEEK